LALLKTTLKEGPQEFQLFAVADLQKNMMSIGVILISLLNLVITFIYGISNNYKYSKTLGRGIGGLYVAFAIASTIYAVYNAIFK
jgi:hypothetical protein